MNIFSQIKLALQAKKLIGLIKEAYVLNLKDWKTTVMGLVLGVWAFTKAYLTNHGITLEGFIESLLPFLLGAYAKDPSNKSQL